MLTILFFLDLYQSIWVIKWNDKVLNNLFLLFDMGKTENKSNKNNRINLLLFLYVYKYIYREILFNK